MKRLRKVTLQKEAGFAGSEEFAAEKVFLLWEKKEFSLLTDLSARFGFSPSETIVRNAPIRFADKKKIYELIAELDNALNRHERR